MFSILGELIERYPILSVCEEDIIKSYEAMCETFQSGGKLMVAGNGGSASDSEHIVGELMKGFRKSRKLSEEEQKIIMMIDTELGESICRSVQRALPAIALTGQIALSTACANDIDSTMTFAQQVYGYGRSEDIFMGISTSGNSQNILNAVVMAKAKGIKTIALTGKDGGKIRGMADISIIVPEMETYKIQELHLPIYHALCLMVEDKFF